VNFIPGELHLKENMCCISSLNKRLEEFQRSSGYFGGQKTPLTGN
jgi:hypothetical protein